MPGGVVQTINVRDAPVDFPTEAQVDFSILPPTVVNIDV